MRIKLAATIAMPLLTIGSNRELLLFGNQQSSGIQTLALTRRWALYKQFVALACLAIFAAIDSGSIAAAAQPVRADFARKGTSDLVIGTPAYTLNGVEYAGVVQIVYGGEHGRTQTLYPLDPHKQGGFGTAVAVGDVNGDGYPDLIVSSFPAIDLSAGVTGSVAVFFGGPDGLSQKNSMLLSQNTVDPADRDTWIGFGFGLVVGDFNGDGFADIAIGAHHWNEDEAIQTGAVFIVPGGPQGPVVPSPPQLIYEGTPGLGGEEQSNQFFGFQMAVGDFNGDGFTDLAIGAPGDAQVLPGQVFLLRGSPAGLVPTGTILSDGAEDHFALVMTAGDFNGDKIADLVVGTPQGNVNGHTNAGAIYVYPGSATGINPKKVQILTQDTPGVPGPASDNAKFGAVLGVGDFNGDGYDGLAASADQTVGGHPHAGAVDVLYGSPGGLRTAGAQLLTERSPADGDLFGASLAAGRFGHEESSEWTHAADGLAVTIGGKQVGLATGAGAVEVIQGSHGRLSPWLSRVYTQNDFPGTRAQKDAAFGCYFGTFDTTMASSSSPF